jgi:hypothetical protein
MKRLEHGRTKFFRLNFQGLLHQVYFQTNMAVKETRRTHALLKVGFSFGFTGFLIPCHPVRHLLLRW